MIARLLTVVLALGMIAVLIVLFVVRPGAATGGGGDLDVAGQPRLGSADAPAQIALFEDFRCPHCASFTEQIKPQIVRELVDTGEAAIYEFSFPILGQASNDAAAVAECAAEQGDAAFWGLQPVLLRSQDQLTGLAAAIRVAREYANVVGIDIAELEACVDDGTGRELADADAEVGRSLGLNSTPSVLVNGERVDPTYDAVVAAVRSAE